MNHKEQVSLAVYAFKHAFLVLTDALSDLYDETIEPCEGCGEPTRNKDEEAAPVCPRCTETTQ